MDRNQNTARSPRASAPERRAMAQQPALAAGRAPTPYFAVSAAGCATLVLLVWMGASLYHHTADVRRAADTSQLTAESPDLPFDPFAIGGIPPAWFRDRVLTLYRDELAKNQFEQAAALVAASATLFQPSTTLGLQADAWHQCAQNNAADDDFRTAAEAAYRRAGRLYLRKAQLDFATRGYPDELLQAGEALRAGHDFRLAATAFEEYLRQEPRRQRPATLVKLADCYLALGRTDDAIRTSRTCIRDFPHDAARYPARLMEARALIEQDHDDEAIATLHALLTSEQLTSASREWREALFYLAEIDACTGKYEQAISRLGQFVALEPASPRTIRARYLTAECARQWAAACDRAHADQRARHLSLAIKNYERVRHDLLAGHAPTKLSTEQRDMLRNCCFAIGGACFDLGRYEDAIAAYTLLLGERPDEKVAGDALLQIAHCYLRMNKPELARQTAQRALATSGDCGELLNWLAGS